MNNQVWLYLNPNTFLWVLKNSGFVYNSDLGKGFKFENTGEIEIITKKLLKIENYYCTTINQQTIEKNNSLNEFVSSLKEIKAGNIINNHVNCAQPIVLPPLLHLNIEKKISTNPQIIKKNILDNLFDINIFLGGKCNYNCNKCKSFFNQLPLCNGWSSVLKFDTIIRLLEQVDSCNVSLIVSDVLNYSYWEQLIEYLKQKDFQTTIIFHYKNFFSKNQSWLNEVSKIKIYVDFSETDIEFNLDLSINNNSNFIFVFILTSEDDYNKAEFLINKNELKEYEFVPFYNNYNLDFFEENIFTTIIDIENIGLNKRQVHMQSVLNTHNFGTLSLIPNGKILSGSNKIEIGSIFDLSLKELIYKEMTSKKSWFLLKSNIKPCSNCVYNIACPPTSSYEKVFKRNNLCKIYTD